MAVTPAPHGRPPSALEERRAQFKRYKEDVKDRGKPFFPYAMFHDTVMSLIVVCVIVALAVIWKWSAWAGETPHNGLHEGLLGPEFTERADPGTTNFVPRPDWYFYFLFYLLRIFKWPESVFLGTVGVPTIALILLIALPFYDLRRERNPLRRPVAMTALILTIISMAVLTYKGATAKESLASEVVEAVPGWVKKQGLPQSAVPGAKLFAESGCTACHTYLGTGSSNVGAPDLSEIGKNNQGVDFFQRYVADPSKFGNNVMPKFESLGQERLRQIAIFLNASKGEK